MCLLDKIMAIAALNYISICVSWLLQVRHNLISCDPSYEANQCPGSAFILISLWARDEGNGCLSLSFCFELWFCTLSSILQGMFQSQIMWPQNTLYHASLSFWFQLVSWEWIETRFSVLGRLSLPWEMFELHTWPYIRDRLIQLHTLRNLCLSHCRPRLDFRSF